MTNDDGFEAIGIQALLASTKTLDPIMVAPKHNCSGMSAAISLRKDRRTTRYLDSRGAGCTTVLVSCSLVAGWCYRMVAPERRSRTRSNIEGRGAKRRSVPRT